MKEIFKYSNILIIVRVVKPELNITIVLKIPYWHTIRRIIIPYE